MQNLEEALLFHCKKDREILLQEYNALKERLDQEHDQLALADRKKGIPVRNRCPARNSQYTYQRLYFSNPLSNCPTFTTYFATNTSS
jgi:hypothetical protein